LEITRFFEDFEMIRSTYRSTTVASPPAIEDGVKLADGIYYSADPRFGDMGSNQKLLENLAARAAGQ
jgi:hypothetical protein